MEVKFSSLKTSNDLGWSFYLTSFLRTQELMRFQSGKYNIKLMKR